jgi:hypothetical protein
MATVYKVTTIEIEGEKKVAWASSEGAAKKMRRELAEEYDLKPLKDVSYEAVEVPTSKAGIIEWLNENYTSE